MMTDPTHAERLSQFGATSAKSVAYSLLAVADGLQAIARALEGREPPAGQTLTTPAPSGIAHWHYCSMPDMKGIHVWRHEDTCQLDNGDVLRCELHP